MLLNAEPPGRNIEEKSSFKFGRTIAFVSRNPALTLCNDTCVSVTTARNWAVWSLTIWWASPRLATCDETLSNRSLACPTAAKAFATCSTAFPNRTLAPSNCSWLCLMWRALVLTLSWTLLSSDFVCLWSSCVLSATRFVSASCCLVVFKWLNASCKRKSKVPAMVSPCATRSPKHCTLWPVCRSCSRTSVVTVVKRLASSSSVFIAAFACLTMSRSSATSVLVLVSACT
mmetsp:Transcript_51476/g.144582  ORF Transcript_51476/g.144582 Transcript_51476/m.144582 type:complete len:230 (-) Transcript_51476:456-1145(-)